MAEHTPERQRHGFAPIYDRRSAVLVLGSFPSVRSREEGFYYAHPRNRFWPLLARVFGRGLPRDDSERQALLLENGVALWDVAERCDIVGSSDASIRSVSANDISPILAECDIREIIANGTTAARLYRELIEPRTGRAITALPSTSPANAAWTPERLFAAWGPHLIR